VGLPARYAYTTVIFFPSRALYIMHVHLPQPIVSRLYVHTLCAHGPSAEHIIPPGLYFDVSNLSLDVPQRHWLIMDRTFSDSAMLPACSAPVLLASLIRSVTSTYGRSPFAFPPMILHVSVSLMDPGAWMWHWLSSWSSSF
jgi:hypothetical protein